MDYKFKKIEDAQAFCDLVNKGEGLQYCEPWEIHNESGEVTHWEVLKDEITSKYE
jgi:hypothetical protein